MKPTILIVDDNDVDKDSLADRLQLAGYDVVVAAGRCEYVIEDALRILEETIIHMALVDMRLCRPEIEEDDSGIRFIIEAKRRYPELVIVGKTFFPPYPDHVVQLMRRTFPDAHSLAVDYVQEGEFLKRGEFERRVENVCRSVVQVNFEVEFEDRRGLLNGIVRAFEERIDG